MYKITQETTEKLQKPLSCRQFPNTSRSWSNFSLKERSIISEGAFGHLGFNSSGKQFPLATEKGDRYKKLRQNVPNIQPIKNFTLKTEQKKIERKSCFGYPRDKLKSKSVLGLTIETCTSQTPQLVLLILFSQLETKLPKFIWFHLKAVSTQRPCLFWKTDISRVEWTETGGRKKNKCNWRLYASGQLIFFPQMKARTPRQLSKLKTPMLFIWH